VKAALADPGTSCEKLLELLCEMLKAFVSLVLGGTQVESRRLLFARSEVEDTPGLEQLHESGRRHVFVPCLSMIARLTGRPADDAETSMRTLALIGQVTIFCHKGALDAGAAAEFTPDRVRLIQDLVREHTIAIFRAVSSKAASLQ
jgi:hypothetical protein